MLALLAMWSGRKLKLSIVGTAVCGGVFHNLGQLIAASIVLKTSSTLYLASVLLPLGIVSGAVVGVIAVLTLKQLTQDKSKCH